MKIPLYYEPRPYQLPILTALDSGIKRAIWVCHRRAGKDYTIWNWSVKEAVIRKQIIYYILPTYAQAKKIIWTGMTRDGLSFIDSIPKALISRKSEQELSVELINGSLIQLVGSENYDRLVGTNPSICVFSEAALQDQKAWEYMRPILAENQGVAIFVSTPRGKNWFYDLYSQAKENDSWFCEVLTVDDTRAITRESITAEKEAGMSEEMIRQEFYCDFLLGVEGSYYAKYIDSLKKERHICSVPYDATAKVYTSWDIGIGDSTAIVFFQLVGNEIHIIDGYSNNGEGFSHYAKILSEKPYIYAEHFAPHDIRNRELSTGLSRLQTCKNLGINFTVLPTLDISIADGIEMVRGMFPRFWFDVTKCKDLIKCLENYRKEYDERHNVFKLKPLHDWTSHYADSMRYLSIAIRTSLKTGSFESALDKHRQVVDSRRTMI